MTLSLLLALGEGLATVGVFLFVSLVRFESDPGAVWSVGVDVRAASSGFALTWVAVAWWLGLYRLGVRWSVLADARDVGRTAVVVGLLTLSLLFLTHQDDVSRLFLAMLFVTQPVVALAIRVLVRWWFEGRRRRGRDLTRMIVVGTGPLAEEFANSVEGHPSLGIRVVGHLSEPFVDRRNGDDGKVQLSRPVLGSADDLPNVLRDRVIDEVAVCLPPSSANYVEPVVSVAAHQGKTVRIPRDREDGLLSGAVSEDFDQFVLQSVIHDGQREVERALKRLIDVTGALIGLALLSPVLVGTAAMIRIRDGSPVLFRQVRVGLHGRQFTIVKFRTMVVDAEQQYADVAHLSDTRGAAFKMENDPRVTPLGRTLRKWTLDELPQLWNVVKGDMSLVGPRPAPPREVDAYDFWHRRRLSVRPGMTGLWQVQARFDHHFDDRAELDLKYIDQWSLWMDVGILLRTLPAVLTPRGR